MNPTEEHEQGENGTSNGANIFEVAVRTEIRRKKKTKEDKSIRGNYIDEQKYLVFREEQGEPWYSIVSHVLMLI